MTTLPVSGYWEDNARTEGEGKQWGEDIRDVIAELLGGSAATMLTIASGVILPISANHTIEGQGSVSDDLTNITTTNTPDGRLLLITAYNAAHVITVKDAAGGAGQIHLLGNADYSLDGTDKWILLKRAGTDWYEIFRSHHGIEHERAGVDEVNGDHLDIDYSPTYSVPATTPAEAANVDDLAAHLFGVDALFGHFAKGYIQRSQFTYNGGVVAYTIKAKPAVYWCKDKLCQWVTELTTGAVGTPAADDWYYLYLDYSEITNGTTIIAAKLIWSNTEPVWNDTYMGWYNGDDRCIFAVRTNAAPDNILEFFHDGGDEVFFHAQKTVRTKADLDNTYVDCNCSNYMPKFAKKAEITVALEVKTADAFVSAQWITKDMATGDYHIMIGLERIGTDQMIEGPCSILTNSSQVIEVRTSRNGDDQVGLYLKSWYFPISI